MLKLRYGQRQLILAVGFDRVGSHLSLSSDIDRAREG
jgi:hypothetical protein